MFGRDDILEKISKATIALTFILMGLIFFLSGDFKRDGLSLFFGSLVGILSFKLIQNVGERAVTMTPEGAYKYTVKHYFLRYIIYFIVLFISAKADYLNFLYTVIGLMLVKFVIIIYTLIDFKRNK